MLWQTFRLGQGQDILNSYVETAPSPQNALDIFKGEWASQLPPPFEDLAAGDTPLFEDERITWLAEYIGGVADKTVLELGPLEGGHTYMLERLGASSITAIEANSRAFLRCLIIKEIFDLRRAYFLYGDFVEYLRQTGPDFDIGLASGVLYHMKNPVELIALLAHRCRRHIFLWTHYYDPQIISDRPTIRANFTESRQHQEQGFEHTLYQRQYPNLGSLRFRGGSAPFSCWLSRADILNGLAHFGFDVIDINFDQPDHPNGPALALIAVRSNK